MIRTALPFENLLADLQRHGFVIGLDHHLRLQAMLVALHGRCMPSDLRSLLCPIFAASEQQQQLFYSLFDHHYSIFALAPPAPDPELVDKADGQRNPASRRRVNPTRVIVLLLLAAVVASLFLWLRHEPAAQTPLHPPGQVPKNAPESAIPPNQAPNLPGPAPQPVAPNQAPGPAVAPPQRPATSFSTTSIMALLIIVIPAAWFLTGEIARWRRQRLVLQRQEGRLPPRSWSVRLQGTGVNFYSSPAFYTAARRLHTRQTGEGTDLDVGGTVDATIRSAGFAAFRYQRRTRLPDYLVLIDRTALRDHQAQLFDSLATALHEEGLFLERFFYDGDPRECWAEGHGDPLSLVELQRRYPEHRLLLFGDGAVLLDAISGGLASWTGMFSGWKERALLSPVATTEWRVREYRLAGQFLVLPATQEGLRALGDHFRSAQSADVSLPAGGGPSVIPDTPAMLRQHLGADTLVWLCACSVYPELHWDLTLHIACLASLPPGLLTEENLLKLVRLPWFRTGAIPEELRYQLIRELTPAQEREVRSAVIEMLMKTPAPDGTIAADRQQMEIVLQRYILTRRDGASARQLRRILEEMPTNHRHYVALRSMELTTLSPVDFLLPRPLREILFVDGHPLLGMRGMTRLAATLAVIGLGLCSLKVTELFPVNRNPDENGLSAARTLPAAHNNAVIAPVRASLVPVEIRSDPPGSSVQVGDHSCVSPDCRFDLSPGSYLVEAQMAGFAPAQQALIVDGTMRSVPVNLTLQPLPPSPPPGTETGTLVVRAGLPDVLVFVDKAPRGITDSTGNFNVVLEAKAHLVRVQKTGYDAQPARQIRIAKDTSQPLAFVLIPQTAKLEIRGAPAGIELRVNGAVIGKTDGSAIFSAPVNPGDRVVRVTEGLASREVTQKFDPGATVTLEWASIAPARSAPAVAVVTPPLPPTPAPTQPDLAEQAWGLVSVTSDPAQIQSYLDKYPTGLHAGEARSRLDVLLWSRVDQDDSQSLRAYINRLPGGAHVQDAQSRLSELAWNGVNKKDAQALRAFLVQNPNTRFTQQAQSILDQLAKQGMEDERVSADKRAVLDLIARYAAAYTKRDANAVKDTYPNVPGLETIRSFFKATPSVRVTITPDSDPNISGDTASIRCKRLTVITDERGKQISQPDNIVVRCRRAGGRWLIQSVGPK